jgi:hypothetical protein
VADLKPSFAAPMGETVKSAFVLLLISIISARSFGQASNMISISALQHESEVASAYDREDIKRLMRTAQTPDEFTRISLYFDRQAEMYAAKSEEEQKELDRLLALPYHARSYPAQVENTRNRIDHFKALSRKSTEQANLYRACADADESKEATAVSSSD